MKLLVTHMQLALIVLAAACSGGHGSTGAGAQNPAQPSGLQKVNHIIIVMMENHSFDNYFGVLAYAPGSPYHVTSAGCLEQDHGCIDGLSCSTDSMGGLICTNSNQEFDGTPVVAFHNISRCATDLAHTWSPVHQEANFNDPNAALLSSPSDGFVRVNDTMAQPETPTDDETMSFYTQDDLPFYYDLAQKFAISDRYFSSALGPTVPNRLYFMAATSFGHVTTADLVPDGGYKPIAGTIFDLLDSGQITWGDYSQDGPQASFFRPSNGTNTDPHFFPVQDFLTAAAGTSGVAQLPQVVFVDPSFGGPDENDEHPPTDIQRGQAFVSQAINAVRNGPYWKDSVIFVTYDEHGGFYDHVAPPRAPQGGARTPDGISPGQCADLSNPPASQAPGAGANCISVTDAESLCPALAQNPHGPYPENCASFDQLGFRVPFVVVSPFARPHYVSHTIADHTSLLAFIEARFLSDVASGGGTASRRYLTARDRYANVPMDLFDFDNAPSLNTPASQAGLPANDCTPVH
jgi:phospholipase C